MSSRISQSPPPSLLPSSAPLAGPKGPQAPMPAPGFAPASDVFVKAGLSPAERLQTGSELPAVDPSAERLWEGNPDSDPMTHITYLASDELKGRKGPSPEYDKAAHYVEGFLTKYGAAPLNAGDPKSPYFQTFTARSWGVPEKRGSGPVRPFQTKPFEKGFFVSEQMPRETVVELNARAHELKLVPQEKQLTAAELANLGETTGTIENVVGKFEGTGPHKDETIVLLGHLDHIGVNWNKQICHGADDNASGSATLLAALPQLADLQKQGKLDRSVVVLWTAGEEMGLVGSRYFTDHPLPGVGKMVGAIDMDMTGRWDDQRISVIDITKGTQPNYFHPLVEQANQKMADPFDAINHDLNQYVDRQDGASFARKGIDQLMLFEGLSNPQGGGDLIPEYHQPGDDIAKIMRDNGGRKPARVRDLLINIVELASNRQVQSAP